MTRSIDRSKASFWSQLLQRFPQSGLSIAKFCSRHHVAPHAFYYWAKRLKREPLSVPVTSTAPPTPIDSPQQAMVLVRFDEHLQVSVPADRPDILCQLVREFGRPDESLRSSPRTFPPSEFKQVVIRSQTRVRETH